MNRSTKTIAAAVLTACALTLTAGTANAESFSSTASESAQTQSSERLYDFYFTYAKCYQVGVSLVRGAQYRRFACQPAPMSSGWLLWVWP